MKRIFLFVATNIAVIAVIAVLASVLGLDHWLTARHINWPILLGFSVVIGFAGSFISLAISKWIAIHAYGIEVIHEPGNHTEQWLYNKVHDLAERAGIGTPDVGIYDSTEANAFATGMRRNKALVAVSRGLLNQMDHRQLEGVLAHEVAHITNGDMVTMTLLQGVLNTFVIFFSRVIGYAIDLALRRGEGRSGLGIGYFVGYYAAQILLGIFASLIVMAYSRRREFRADAMGAQLEGKDAMVSALWRLKQISEGGGVLDNRAPSLSAMKISNKSGPNRFMRLFCSHPPLEQRIAALQRLQV